jgi:glycine/D-amino acid oxidase-like deaminating enzyme
MMNRSSDIVIVGGGVTGLCAAIHLKTLGAQKVTILERHHVGAGQSHRAAGIVRALVRHEMVAKALAESLAFIKDFEQQFGERIVFHPTGYLLLSEPNQMQVIQDALAAAASAGCVASVIDAHEAREIQPGLRHDDNTGYVYEPGAIYMDPMPTLQALTRVARQLGVEIIEGCCVGDILTENDRVIGVETNHGRLNAPKILVATSTWGKAQLAELGIDVPVYPHRAEMAFFQVPSDDTFQLRCILSDPRSMLYLRPEGNDQMFVGWREGDRINTIDDCEPEDPDDYKQTAHYDRLIDMQQRLATTLPAMANGFVHRTYACVYDYTPDGMPILDRAETCEGLYFALGFSGGGFSISPWVGRCMAELMIQPKKRPAVEPLRLSRFAEGKLIQWANVESVED